MAIPLPFRQINDFQLEAVIQEGPNSLAVRAYQPSLQRRVFIKLLKPHVQDHPRWKARFTREARVCARLKHPHIVDVYTIGEQEGYTYMALEFVEGLSLRELLTEEKILPLSPALEVVRQVLLALEFAHREGIIHRDIKPGNILLDVQGQVRLTDFGLAYLGEDESLTQQGSILGTPAYMSPEQVTGEPLSPASDFFALGATLYEMLTGVKPFGGENYSTCIQKILNEDPPPPSRWNPKIPSELDALVIRLLEKIPTERPRKAGEILSALEEFLPPAEELDRQRELSRLVEKYRGRGASARPATQTETLLSASGEAAEDKKFPRGRRWRVLGGVVLFLALVLIFFLPKTGFFGSQGTTSSEELGKQVTATPPEEPGRDSLASRNSGARGSVPVRDDSSHLIQNVKREPLLPVKIGRELPPGTTKGVQQAERPLAAATSPPPALAGLDLVVEPWAVVSIDGTVRDSLLHRRRFELAPGKHQIVFTHPEFAPRVMEVELEPGQEKSLHYSFYRDAAYLIVEVRPWAEVYLDGRFIDNTPLKRPVILSPGQHLLELKNPYFETVRQNITLVAGDTLRIRQVLRKE